MSQSPGLPEREIDPKIYNFFENIEKEKAKKPGRDYSDLFFAATGKEGEVEVVDKSSAKGKWLAFKASILHAFGCESELSQGKKTVQNMVSTLSVFCDKPQQIEKLTTTIREYDPDKAENIIEGIVGVSKLSMIKKETTGLLESLPRVDSSVQRALQLFGEVKGKQVKDCFFVADGEKINAVDKSSGEGRWLAFKASVLHAFGRESELSKGKKAVENVIGRLNVLQKSAFEEAIRKFDPEAVGGVIQCMEDLSQLKMIQKVGIQLLFTPETKPIAKPLQEQVKVSTTTIPAVHKVVDEVAKEVFKDVVALRKSVEEAIAPVLTLDSDSTETVCAFLTRYAETPQLLSDLQSMEKNPQEAVNSLKRTLMKGMIFSGEKDFKAFEKALGSLEKVEVEKGLKKPTEVVGSVETREFAMVFADASIRDAGLEGHVTSRPFIRYAEECLDAMKIETPEAKALKTVLENSVDLRETTKSAETLKAEIKKNIDTLPEGHQRCLLLGGWAQHAIVYEVEKLQDGKYAFRIYNEGEGIEYHDRKREGYKDRYAGCLAVADIPEKMLFDPSSPFFGCLQKITSVESGQNMLVGEILPMIDGKKEEVDPRIKYFVSPQRSGSCTYRSFQAFLAHSMNEEQYKHFKFQYKMFLLDKYLPQLKEMAKSPLIDEKAYQQATLELSVLTRSIEHFSKGVNNLSGSQGLELAEIEQARDKIVAYQAHLKQLEYQIIGYEKKAHATTLSTLSRVTASRVSVEDSLPDETLEGVDDAADSRNIQSQFLLQKTKALAQVLEGLDPKNPNFNKEIETVIGDIAALVKQNWRARGFEPLYINDLFFKKVGSIEALGKIQFADPEKAFANINEIRKFLTAENTKHYPRSELYVMRLANHCLLENAFRQLPDEVRILPKDFPSFIGSCNLEELKFISCNDPFWASALKELHKMKAENAAYSLPKVSEKGSSTEFSMSPQMANSIWSWWERPENSELLTAVENSVTKDRKDQKEIIHHQKKQLEDAKVRKKQEIEAKNKKIGELQAKGDPGSLQEIRQLKEDNQKAVESIAGWNLQIDGMPKDIHNKQNYWPWGWADSDPQEDIGDERLALKNKEKAAFIFAEQNGFFTSKGIEPPIPKNHPLRSLFDSAIVTSKISSFSKVEHFPVTVIRNEQNGSMEFKCKEITNLGSARDPLWHNGYHKRFSDKKVYENLVKADSSFSETKIPQRVGKISAETPLNSIGVEEYKDLFSIRRGNFFQVEATLEYFLENSHKLEEKDFMLLFQSNLFESDFLLEALRSPKEAERLIQRFDDFFSVFISNAQETGKFALVADLLWTKSTLQRYIDFVSAERAEKGQKPLPTLFSYDELMPLLQKAMDRRYEKSWPDIFSAIVAASRDIGNKTPTDEQLQVVFAANILMKQFPHDNLLPMQKIDIEATQLFIQKYFTKNQKSADFYKPACMLVKQLFPSMPEQFYCDPKDDEGIICSVDKTTRISFSSGDVLSDNPTLFRTFKDLVPDNIKNGFKEAGIYSSDEEMRSLRAQKEDGLLYIKDVKNQLDFIVKSDAGYNNIYRKMVIDGKEVWAYHVEESLKARATANTELREKFHQLQVGRDVYLCDKKSCTPVYKIDQNGRTEEIASKWHVVENPKGLFASFESPDCTIFLADAKGKIQKVEFSRLSISFTRKMDEKGVERWVCDQQKEWRLSQEQFAPHLGPETGFLTLERSVGSKEEDVEKKILLPVWDPKKEEKRALNFPFIFNFQSSQVREARFVECTIKGNRLVPGSVEACLHLGRVYLEKGFQDLAEDLLFSSQVELTSRPFTTQERKLLEGIAFTSASGNMSGRNISVRLHAIYLLERNQAVFKPLEEKTEETVQEENKEKMTLMNEYLNRLGHVKVLDKREELLILKQLVPMIGEDSLLIKRQVELTGGESLSDLPVQYGKKSPSWTELTTAEKDKAKKIEGKTFENEYKKGDLATYFAARKANTFPFSYTSPELQTDDFLKYWNQLANESQKHSLEEMRQSGFLPMLHYLARFCPNGEIQLLSRRILDTIYKKHPSGLESITTQPHVMKNIAVEKKEKIEPPIQIGLRSLHALGNTEPSKIEATYLVDLAEARFQKEIGDTKAKTGGVLFNPDSLEVAGDSSTEKQFELMQKDVAKAESGKETTYSLKSGETVDGLYENILVTYKDEKDALAALETEIIQAVFSALTADPLSEMQFRSNKRQLPTIQELCMLAARPDGDAILQKRYPEFSNEARGLLKEAVRDYLVQKQFVQHLERSKEKIEEIRAAEEKGITPETRAILHDELAKSLVVTRSYTLDDPLAMVFLVTETILKFKLRQDQIDNIRLFDTAQKNGEEVVLQMIMGAGKTSVLQPVLAFLFARPDRLSTVCVPQSLVAEVRLKLSQVLGDAFDQLVVVMPFNRELAKDPVYLKTYLEGLREAKERGAVVLFTPEEKKSIMAAWKESLSIKQAACNEILNDILKEFQSELSQVDEIDLTMNPMVIYKFPIGEKGVVHKERAMVVSNMVLRLAEDKELASKVSLDFVDKFQKRKNPDYKKTGQELSLTLYNQEVAPALRRIALDILKERNPGVIEELMARDGKKYLDNFMLQATPFDEEILRLCSQAEEARITAEIPTDRAELRAYIESKDPKSVEGLIAVKKEYILETKAWLIENTSEDVRNALAVSATAIVKTFKKTLFQECGSNYHVDPQSGVYTARPCFAPGSPKPSVPSDVNQLVILSTQLLLYEEVPRSAAVDIFKWLQIYAEKQVSAENIRLENTVAYQEFARVLGPGKLADFGDKSPPDALIDAFQKALSKDTKSIGEFIEKYVLDQIPTFTNSISVTSYAFVGMSKQNCCYTGTLHEGILSRTMKPQAELGTDGKTIAAVESKIQARQAVIRTLDPQEGRYIEQITKAFATEPDLYVFIDSGNLLKEEKNIQEYVDTVLIAIQEGKKRPDIKGCIFPNIQGEWLSREMINGKLETIPLSQSKLKLSERITVIPSKHETGTDIKQLPTARALDSIRKGMTLRDTLQSVFRMRQVLNAQTIDFVITQEVQDHTATLLLQAAFEKDPYKPLLSCPFSELRGKIASLPNSTEVEKAIVSALDTLLKGQNEGEWNSKRINEKFGEVSNRFSEVFTINSVSLWNYLLKNLAIDQREKNWLAGQQKMKEVFEKPLREVMLGSSFEEREKVYDELRAIFESTERDDPFENLYTSLTVSGQQAIDNEVRRYMRFLQVLEKSDIIAPAFKQKVLDRIKEAYGTEETKNLPAEDILKATLASCVKAEDIPPVLTIGGGDTGEEIEVEKEQDRQQEVERELEVIVEPKVLMGKNYIPLAGTQEGSEGYKLIDLMQRSWPSIQQVLPSNMPKSVFVQEAYDIEFSENLFLSGEKSFTPDKIGSIGHCDYHLSGEYILVCKSPGRKDVYRLVSHQDAAAIKQGMLGDQRAGEWSMALISLNKTVSGVFPSETKFDTENKNVQKAIVQAKLLSGKVSFRKEELAILEEMIGGDEPAAKAVRKMLEGTLRAMPESAKNYQKSDLRELLNRLAGSGVEEVADEEREEDNRIVELFEGLEQATANNILFTTYRDDSGYSLAYRRDREAPPIVTGGKGKKLMIRGNPPSDQLVYAAAMALMENCKKPGVSQEDYKLLNYALILACELQEWKKSGKDASEPIIGKIITEVVTSVLEYTSQKNQESKDGLKTARNAINFSFNSALGRHHEPSIPQIRTAMNLFRGVVDELSYRKQI